MTGFHGLVRGCQLFKITAVMCFTDQMPFLMLIQQHQSTGWSQYHTHHFNSYFLS